MTRTIKILLFREVWCPSLNRHVTSLFQDSVVEIPFTRWDLEMWPGPPLFGLGRRAHSFGAFISCPKNPKTCLTGRAYDHRSNYHRWWQLLLHLPHNLFMWYSKRGQEGRHSIKSNGLLGMARFLQVGKSSPPGTGERCWTCSPTWHVATIGFASRPA